jgi:phytoene dehydrogenase-like protein
LIRVYSRKLAGIFLKLTDQKYDSIIVGSGPNGLAAGIELARGGLKVLIVEAKETVGGGARSEELTLPGFVHDVCSTIHPMGITSPFFKSVPLADFGVKFIEPPTQVAHPLDDGTAVYLKRDINETLENLGIDGKAYKNLMEPFVDNWDKLAPEILEQLHFPSHPFLMARFGLKAMRSIRGFAESNFKGERARAVFTGIAAHASIPLDKLPGGAIGLVLSITAHAVGWPMIEGGSQKIADAMAAYFQTLGGEIETSLPVSNIDDLPSSRSVVFDLTPHQILKIAGRRLSNGYRKRLEKFQYGAGSFKVDWALSETVPWTAPECRESATVHLGGTLDQIARSEDTLINGPEAERPFVLFVQTSQFDPTRAPAGKHTAWAYCHVPNGSTADMTERIENQIERFAPGFRDVVLARAVKSPAQMEARNANYIGGDIAGGANTLGQFFTRPVLSLDPYYLQSPGLYICSASTPPGGGVHGMCGYHAAKSVLRREFGK